MPRSKQLHDYLVKLGNPYASLSVDDPASGASTAMANPSAPLNLGKTQNPYAWHYYFTDEGPVTSIPQTASVESANQANGKLTKTAFQQQARGIFRSYIPAAENGKLRDHHREFIARNETRSPSIRFQLIARLSVYDISTQHGFTAVFNREDDVFTKQKLDDIERLVGNDQ